MPKCRTQALDEPDRRPNPPAPTGSARWYCATKMCSILTGGDANDSDLGLQVGALILNLYLANRAWDLLDVGGVVIGDVPSRRIDHMPYSGVKDGDLGRAGVWFALEDMTQICLSVLREHKTPEGN